MLVKRIVFLMKLLCECWIIRIFKYVLFLNCYENRKRRIDFEYLLNSHCWVFIFQLKYVFHYINNLMIYMYCILHILTVENNIDDTSFYLNEN